MIRIVQLGNGAAALGGFGIVEFGILSPKSCEALLVSLSVRQLSLLLF